MLKFIFKYLNGTCDVIILRQRHAEESDEQEGLSGAKLACSHVGMLKQFALILVHFLGFSFPQSKRANANKIHLSEFIRFS